MWALTGTGFKKYGGRILAALSFLAMLATVWLSSRKVGKAEAEANASEQRAGDREAIATREVNEAREASQREVEVIQGANDVKTNNSIVDDDGVNQRLRDDWTRD